MYELGITDHWWDIAKRHTELSNHPNTLKPLGYAFIFELIEAFKPKRVLEVGHGAGSFLFSTFKDKIEVWGLDAEVKDSSVSVEDLKNVRIWHPEVRFVEGLLGSNLAELPDNYFDLVFSVSVVEHIPEEVLPSVFKDAYRILKPGGIFAHSYDVYYGQNVKALFDAYETAGFDWLKQKDTMNVFWEKWLCPDGNIPSSLFEKVVTENPMFVSEVYMWQQVREKRQAPMNYFTILNAGRKPLEKTDTTKSLSKITPENFDEFTYSRKDHFNFFNEAGYTDELFKSGIDTEFSDLRSYQELLAYSFIKENIPAGSKILEIGGNYPTILRKLKGDYECWDLYSSDEAITHLKEEDSKDIKLIKDNIGNFNKELPDNYFDFVFSVSALNETPDDEEKYYENILKDVNRILKPGGYSMHSFVLLWGETNRVWTSRLISYLYDNQKIINDFVHPFKLVLDKELYMMSEKFYNANWESITKKSYRKFGKPFSYNVIWKKD
ncbi:MAG: class I SAM-dependent methyltransferase [bacterium]